jgi:hypothetical protein
MRSSPVGEPTVRIIQGGDPRRFISPRGESAETRDLERMKLLVRLTGTAVPEESWIKLFGNEVAYRETAKSDTIAETDPLEKARKLKRDIEMKAREVEAESEREQARASGIRQTIADIDTSRPHDERALADEMHARSARLSSLEADARAAKARIASFEAARHALEAAASLRDGVSSIEAQDALNRAVDGRAQAARVETDAVDRVRACERALAEAKSAHAIAVQGCRAAQQQVDSCQQNLASSQSAESALESAQSVVRAGSGDTGPGQEEILKAREALEEARKAIQYGDRVRLALKKSGEADQAAEIASEKAHHASALREMARGTEGVLTSSIASIASAGMRIAEGRLWFRRGEVDELVDTLSDGARSTLCFRIMADAAQPGGVVIVDQNFWESIGPKRREELVEEVASLPISVLTSECHEGGELRSEALEPSGASSTPTPGGDFAFEE